MGSSSIIPALTAFSLANSFGEANGESALAEEADELCARAIDTDPSNPLVLALVSHVHSFVHRRFEFSADYLAIARQIDPSLALAWDLSAMNAIYRGNMADAIAHSRRAISLGAQSVYRPLFQSAEAIALSLDGQHEAAITRARSVLHRMPNFVAMQRYLFGSLAAARRFEEAEEALTRLRAVDPHFNHEGVGEPSYPLPSAESVALVRAGMKLLGQPY